MGVRRITCLNEVIERVMKEGISTPIRPQFPLHASAKVLAVLTPPMPSDHFDVIISSPEFSGPEWSDGDSLDDIPQDTQFVFIRERERSVT